MLPNGLTLQAVTAELSRRSLKTFVKEHWHIVEPVPFQDGPHIDALCEHLLHLKEIRNLIICLPRRHSKTLVVNLWMVWRWLHEPSARFIFGSSGEDLATKDHDLCRRLLTSSKFQGEFPHLRLRDDFNTKKRFDNEQGGFRVATTVGGTGIGFGAEYLIADDVLKPTDADSKAARDFVTDWYTGTFMNLTTKNTCRIVMQQRLHNDDLVGRIIANDAANNWTKLIIPLEYSKQRSYPSRYWTDPRTEEGQLLCPAVMDKEEVVLRKASMTKAQFAAQFNQDPISAKGDLIKEEDLSFFTNQEIPDTFRIAAIDLAISEKSTADYTVCLIADITYDGQVFVRDMLRRRIGPLALVDTLADLCDRWEPERVLVEDVGFQKMVLSELRQKGIPAVSVKPATDKVSRSVPMQLLIEAHKVHLPEDAPWVDLIVNELTGFPDAPNDDITDSLAYICSEAKRRTRGYQAPPPPLSPDDQKKHDEEEEKKRYVKMLNDDRYWSRLR